MQSMEDIPTDFTDVHRFYKISSPYFSFIKPFEHEDRLYSNTFRLMKK